MFNRKKLPRITNFFKALLFKSMNISFIFIYNFGVCCFNLRKLSAFDIDIFKCCLFSCMIIIQRIFFYLCFESDCQLIKTMIFVQRSKSQNAYGTKQNISTTCTEVFVTILQDIGKRPPNFHKHKLHKLNLFSRLINLEFT